MWQMRQNFVAQFVQLLKPWLYYVQLGIVTEKIWALSLYQCWLQTLQFSVHLIDLMTILLRCNGFSKSSSQQTSSRPPDSDHDTLFGASFALRTALELLSPLRADCRWLSYTIHFSSHVTIQSRNGYLWRIKKKTHPNSNFFFFLDRFMRHVFTKLFLLYNLLQMTNYHIMVETEFFGNFSSSCKRISFDDCTRLSPSTSYGQPLHFSSSKLLSPFQNFLHYHCSLKFINRSWVKCIIDIANCLCLKNKILNSKKKIARICFLSSIISLV